MSDTTQCWPSAIPNPNASVDPSTDDKKRLLNECIMPLRYYDDKYISTTMYSWLTYQPKTISGSNPDLFASAYGNVFASNPSVDDPDIINQNRLNLYQPNHSNLLYRGLQWVAAVYPNASDFNSGVGDCMVGKNCPGYIYNPDYEESMNCTNYGSDQCDPGCSYWAHEYNLENVYLTPQNPTNGDSTLLPEYPPRKALYGLVAQNPNNPDASPGQPVKYGDVFSLIVSLLDINPNIEKTDFADKSKAVPLLSPVYKNMTLLLTNDTYADKSYIILGQTSVASGGSAFEYLATGTVAAFQIKSLNSQKSDGSDGTQADVVMSGDQFYLVDSGTGNPVKWETLNFSQAWHPGNHNQSLIPQATDSSHNSWLFSNRYYWQANVYSEAALQLQTAPPQTYRQWYPYSTQGVSSYCESITPTGSILLLGLQSQNDTPALHWFLDARSGRPQMENKTQTCTDNSDCTDANQICDTNAGLCRRSPANQVNHQKAIMIMFLVLGGAILFIVLIIGYKVYEKRQEMQAKQLQEHSLKSELLNI